MILNHRQCVFLILEVQSLQFLSRASLIEPELNAIIPLFHRYAYDGTSPGVLSINFIQDGGNDMYDGGNRVRNLKTKNE